MGQVIAERYHVIQLLGEGGMGRVYLAEHVKMGRKSAIKVMNHAMMHDAEAIGRFNREASNASRISHPNVAAIYDFGETSDGLIFLAMEYVEGRPLTTLLAEPGGGALPPVRVAAIVRQVGGALDAAHELGIVHRDLKPDNIMIARGRDGSDVVKVVDFGIAKAGQMPAQQVTRTGLVIGTPEYMSPEQLSGDVLDGRSDIYTLALVAFNMLTGLLPFPGTTVQESLILRLTERPQTLSEIKPGANWPRSLQAVLDRALARYPAERYTRAGDFAADFSRAAASEIAGAPSVGSSRTLVISSEIPATRARPSAGATSGGSAWRRKAAGATIVAVLVFAAAGAFASRAATENGSNKSTDRSAVAISSSVAASRAPVSSVVSVQSAAPLKVVPMTVAQPESSTRRDRALRRDPEITVKQIEALAADMETAEQGRKVEEVIRANLPLMQRPARIMQVKLHLGQAVYLQGRQREACEIWSSVMDGARGTLKRQIDVFHSTYCQ
ncbi:MAG: serine/threonine-protein kinase [Gemmatimonadaceae bacterium]